MSSPPPGWTCCAGRSRSPRAWASDAPPLLLKAAARLEPLDLDLARETYLDALGCGTCSPGTCGRQRSTGGLPGRPGRCPPAHPPRAGRPAARRPGAAGHRRPGRRGAGAAAGSSRLRQRGHPRRRATPVGLAGSRRPPTALWDVDGWRAIAAGQIRLAREAGALDKLPIGLACARP